MLQHSQEKNDTEVEKVATIFLISFESLYMGSELVMRFKKCEHQTREDVLPCMREYAGAKTAAKESEQTEEHTEDRKQNHVARALISMRRAKEKRREDHAHSYNTASPRGELAMEISAKDDLFRDSGDDA